MAPYGLAFIRVLVIADSRRESQADYVKVVDCVLEAGRKHSMLYKVQLSEDPSDIIYRTYDDFFDFNLMLHGVYKAGEALVMPVQDV
jgi:hypothetical protein